MSFPIEIVPLEDIPSHPNLLIFGDSGSGKTVLAASDDDVLILNTEPQGTVSAKMMGLKASVAQIKSINDLERVYDYLLTRVEKGDTIPYTWVVIDSLTELQDMLMREILAEGRKKKSNKSPWVPEWPDYLQNQKRIVRIVKEFNSLPVNILYTCLTTSHVDTEGNDFIYPAIHGRKFEIAQLVLAQTTCYGYLFTKDQFETKDGKKKKIGVDRYVLWESTGSFRGKDRTTALAPWTKNCTLKQIRRKIENAENRNEETKVVSIER